MLHAGRFSTWLRNTRISLVEGRSMVVPCGECNACCKSSQFIHFNPEEIRTINRIPKDLLFPAPFLPKGHMIMGYDEYGCCPMYVIDNCSIYRNRPATCRRFDCRVLAASGIDASEKNYNLIARQVRRWKFSYPADLDRKLHLTVQSAAAFLATHRNSFPAGWVPENSIQLSFLSAMVYDAFTGKSGQAGRNSDIVGKILKSYSKFDSSKRCTSPAVILRS